MFGDHLLITFTYSHEKPAIGSSLKRDWRHYTPTGLKHTLAEIWWDYVYDSVQSCWDTLESGLVRVIDKMAPMVPFVNNSVIREDVPRQIKDKLNSRKKLLQKQKHRPTVEVRNRIKELNCEIKTYFHGTHKQQVRRNMRPGDSKSIWNAVNIAKDMSVEKLPKDMFNFLNNLLNISMIFK